MTTDNIQATEVNGDTIISIDKDGAGTQHNFEDIVKLDGTTNLDIEDMFNNGEILV